MPWRKDIDSGTVCRDIGLQWEACHCFTLNIFIPPKQKNSCGTGTHFFDITRVFFLNENYLLKFKN